MRKVEKIIEFEFFEKDGFKFIQYLVKTHNFEHGNMQEFDFFLSTELGRYCVDLIWKEFRGEAVEYEIKKKFTEDLLLYYFAEQDYLPDFNIFVYDDSEAIQFNIEKDETYEQFLEKVQSL